MSGLELRLLTLVDTPLVRCRVFRVAIAARAFFATFMAVMFGGCAYLAAASGAVLFQIGLGPWLLSVWILFWTGLFLFLCALDLRKALQPDAWVAAVGDEGVYLKWRSYQNRAWGLDDAQVVLVPFAAIEAAWTHRRRWLTPTNQNSGHAHVESVDFVELRIHPGVPLSELERVLTDERGSKPGGRPRNTTWKHFPLSLEPEGVLRMEWRARPGMDSFLAALRERGVHVEDSRRTEADLGDGADEAQLRELARRGDVMGLVRVLRRARGLDLTAAKEAAEALVRRRGA